MFTATSDNSLLCLLNFQFPNTLRLSRLWLNLKNPSYLVTNIPYFNHTRLF
jgi:hypothetical protein